MTTKGFETVAAAVHAEERRPRTVYERARAIADKRHWGDLRGDSTAKAYYDCAVECIVEALGGAGGVGRSLHSAGRAFDVARDDGTVEHHVLPVPRQCDDCLPDGTCTMNCSSRRPDQPQYRS